MSYLCTSLQVVSMLINIFFKRELSIRGSSLQKVQKLKDNNIFHNFLELDNHLHKFYFLKVNRNSVSSIQYDLRLKKGAIRNIFKMKGETTHRYSYNIANTSQNFYFGKTDIKLFNLCKALYSVPKYFASVDNTVHLPQDSNY